MSEIRKVIGVFDSLVAKKDGIAFPSVRVWIRGVNDYETRGLEQSFPERGTVFLHVSACENQHPQRNQVGLFNCVESPGQTAEWKVSTTSRHLAKVIDCPVWERKPEQLAFWEWLVAYKDAVPCNILLSEGTAFVRRGKRELVGPFAVSPENKLVAREQTFLFEEIESVGVEIAGRQYSFIDTELLPKGKLLVLDPKEAIHRRLKLANRTGSLEWLSRTKIQELSTALTGVTVADGSEWVMENLSHALEVLSSSGNLDAKVAEAILQIKAVEEALEAAWKRKHADAIRKAEEEIDGLKKIATEIRQSIKGLNAEVGRLQKEKASLEVVLSELNGKIEEAKAEAENVFDAELKRLTQSPASMALFAAWSGAGNKAADRAQPLIKVQRWGADRQQAANLLAALFNNLKAYGLSPSSATEVAAVCGATLEAGQPISFRSFFSDLLADAVASALGQPLTVWADVPAGLLDPIDWDIVISADQKGCPMILQAANRSDIPLVLGSLRSSLLQQALGYQKPGGVVLLTLEANSEMQVQSDFHLGPLIDDRVLRFNPTKAAAAMCAFTGYAKDLPEVALVSAEEFAEIGEDVLRLPLFATSAQKVVFRRSYGALRKHCDKPVDVPRLFFKYWCLPRLSSCDVRSILEARKEVWGQDKSLSELTQSLIGNE